MIGVLVVGVLLLIPNRSFIGDSPDAVSVALAEVTVAKEGVYCFYNPAVTGLSQGEIIMFSFDYVYESIEDVLNYESKIRGRYFSYFLIGEGGVNLSYRPVSRKDLVNENGEIIYSVDEFLLNLASLLYFNFYGGVNFKYYYVRYGEALRWGESYNLNLDTGNGYGVDIGFVYTFGNINVGLSGINIISKVYYKDYESDRPPTIFRGAVVFHPHNLVRVGIGGEKNSSSELRDFFNAGIEFKPFKSIWLRGGLTTSSISKDDFFYSFGFGVSVRSTEVNFGIRKSRVYLTLKVKG